MFGHTEITNQYLIYLYINLALDIEQKREVKPVVASLGWPPCPEPPAAALQHHLNTFSCSFPSFPF